MSSYHYLWGSGNSFQCRAIQVMLTLCFCFVLFFFLFFNLLNQVTCNSQTGTSSSHHPISLPRNKQTKNKKSHIFPFSFHMLLDRRGWQDDKESWHLTSMAFCGVRMSNSFDLQLQLLFLELGTALRNSWSAQNFHSWEALSSLIAACQPGPAVSGFSAAHNCVWS